MDRKNIEARDGLISISVRTKFGKLAVKVHPETVLELADAIRGCPGSKRSLAHAVWHFRNPSMPCPCESKDTYVWH